MALLQKIYKPSLSLLTDLYQLTMAYGYWKNGLAEREAVFHLFFRKNPFKGGYAVAAGLEYALSLMEGYGFSEEDIAYLGTLEGNNGKPLFEAEFLQFLQEQPFACDVDAMPEGSIAFPHQPMLRIKGPLFQAQLLETPLLTILNFQSLIATKSARVCQAAEGDTVLEFGLRRAQGPDGGLSASRAAYVGGAHATSNVLAGRLFGIPVKGTHAHSWVMAFDSEEESFEAYAAALPNNCVFLVDTYDTVEGVKKAVTVGKKLREKGFEMVGVRLDSGDLAALSIEARRILDEGGFPDASVVASNDLNDLSIADLKSRGAKIDVWGVGTKLATAYEQPALGGVFKLAAIRGEDGEWDFKVKLSEQLIKVSNPGIQQVRRHYQQGRLAGDVIYNEADGTFNGNQYCDFNEGVSQSLPEFDRSEDVLVPVFRKGKQVYSSPSLDEIRQNTLQNLAKVSPKVRKLQNSELYPCGLAPELYKLKTSLIQKAKHT